MNWDMSRPGETEAPLPDRCDARLVFIGRIRTPFLTRDDCPRRGHEDGPECRIEVDETWRPGLTGVATCARLEILYWMHQARRDLITQNPKRSGLIQGTFALRSPVRPNPVATSEVRLVRAEPWGLVVRGLDCIDGTPLLDIKPARGEFRPAEPVPSAS